MPQPKASNGSLLNQESTSCTLVVPDHVAFLIKNAYESINEVHQGALTFREFFEALLLAGLETVSYQDADKRYITALCVVANPDWTRRSQKDAMSFLQVCLGVPGADGSNFGELVKVIRQEAEGIYPTHKKGLN